MTTYGDDLALFDMPGRGDERKGDPTLVHVLLPCMLYACEENILTVAGTWTTAGSWDKVTCPACLEHGEHACRRATYRQQGEASWARWLEQYPQCTETWPCPCEDGKT